MKPYLIVAHDYKRTSAGVRALHYLAHSINESGGTAYVVADVINRELNTPRADRGIIESIARDGIVVYPEVEEGNPLQAMRVARFVLNVPGYIRGSGDIEPFDACFHYAPLLTRHVPKTSEVLTVPVVDLDLFYNPIGGERCGSLMWAGKGHDQYMPDVWDRAQLCEITPDWPADRETLAALFQNRRMLYSYTDYTALVTEARLCGCAAVVIPSGHFTLDDFERCPGGASGLAWGSTHGEIVAALGSVAGFYERYKRDMCAWPSQFERFIEITQGI